MRWEPFRHRALCALAALALGFAAAPLRAQDTSAPGSAHEAALTFGALPRLAAPKLSPDGTRYAALEPVDGRYAIVIHTLDATAQKTIVYRDDEVSVEWFRWAGENRLLVAVSFPGNRGRAATIETRLYGIDADGSHKTVLPRPWPAGSPAQVGTNLVAAPQGDPSHILLNLDRDGRGIYSVYRVDIESGDAEMIERGTRRTATWLADPAGVVRGRIDYDGSWREIWARTSESDAWRLVRRDNVLDGAEFIPLAFNTKNPNEIFVATDAQTGRLAIYGFDITTSRLGPVMFQRPDVDVEGLIQDARSGEVMGFTYVGHHPVREYVGDAMRAQQSELDTLFPGMRSNIISSARDNKRSIIYTDSFGQPGSYSLRDSTARSMIALGAQYPALDRQQLASVVPWSYRARDGLFIPAYITLPAGAALVGSVKKWPVVIMPHGGPTTRDYIGFDFIAQFLASQGYAVVQPNFRGSAGYGRSFEAAGRGEWGAAMQDDLTDGVHALVALGFADPHRIAILGASYGGYAALMGAVREPDLFRCAVSINGVSDLPMFVKQLDYFRYANVRKPLVVDPPDAQTVEGRSPLSEAAKIKIPILLVHGKNDHIVPIAHARNMARTLKEEGKDVEFVTLPQSDHNILVEPDRIAMLEVIGAFLARNMN